MNPNLKLKVDKKKNKKFIYLKCKTESFTERKKMTLKQYLLAGVIEQVIVLGFILPATGWWFSFFAISAIWNLVAGTFLR